MRQVIWGILDPENSNRVLQHLAEDVRGEFLQAMDTAQLVAAAHELATDDFADIQHQLPARITDEVRGNMDAAERAREESVQSYADDSAGG